MQVYKFGGASVKDADAVRNVATILRENNFNEKGLSLIIKKNKNKGSNQTYLSISNPHYATHACTKSSIHTHQPHI